jgi:glycosyltransferase involved in cell wall biosynthesis
MRTLLSVNNYYYRRGGAEVVFFEHNRLLIEQGWRVVPFAMHHAQNLPSEWSRFFVEEVELGEKYTAAQKISKAIKALYSFEAKDKIGRLISKTRPDICHAHNVYYHLSPAILGPIAARGIPIVMTLHDLKLACPARVMRRHGRICESCKSGLYNVLVHRCMKGSWSLSFLAMIESYLHTALNSYVKHVDKFVSPSRFLIRKLTEWGYDEGQFVHVPNFVDCRQLSPSRVVGNGFVYVGRLSAEKGLTTLVAASAEAQIKLTLVGTGPEENNLRTFAAELGADVAFAGHLSGKNLHDAIRSARAVVLPSECYENAPLAVLEAFALGKPVIGSSLGGIPELVRSGETGYLFDAGSVPGLVAALRAVTEAHDAEILQMGSAGRELVEREHSPQSYSEGIARVYGELGVNVKSAELTPIPA